MREGHNHDGRVPRAPRGYGILFWIGPGIIWMISAIATGELLFTPRVASLYGYTLLWAMIAAIVLKAIVAREIGRYAIVTGGSILHGMRRLTEPRQWLIWLIILPQIVVAVGLVTGMSGAAGLAIILAVPGAFVFWSIAFLIISIALVFFGRYKGVEWASIVMSLIITVALIIAAVVVFPGWQPLATGMVPILPEDVDLAEVLPWLGFMMSGAAGLIWYSYWLPARGYGMARPEEADDPEPVDICEFSEEEQQRLMRWLRVVTIVTTISATIVLLLADRASDPSSRGRPKLRVIGRVCRS
jgi:Mn2+/Fe2+ NRAMP family transporter